MGNTKMLRNLILLFLPSMITANERDPYMYRTQPAPSISTEQPKKFPANNLPNYQTTYNLYSFTDRPINPPIIIVPDARPEQKKPYNEIPGPFSLNENAVTGNFENYVTTPIDEEPIDFNLRPKRPDNEPTNEHFFLPDIQQHYESKIPEYTGKQINEGENIQPFPYFQKPDQLFVSQLPMTEVPEKQGFIPFRPDPYELKLPVLTEKPVNNLKINPVFLPHNTPELYNLQPPVYEEPVNTPFDLENRPQYGYKLNLPVPKIPVYDTGKSKENLIKEKLVSLIVSSKKDLERHVKNIQNIHDNYKSGTMYKIGYLTSVINKANESLSKLYKNVQNNHQKWDSLRVLDTYEEVKAESEFIQNMLRVMLSFINAKRKNLDEEPKPSLGQRDVRPSISWSYYDDSMP